MSYNQPKVSFPQVYRRKRATKKETWCGTPTDNTNSRPCPQSTYKCDDFPLLKYLKEEAPEWREPVDKERFTACFKTCLKYDGQHNGYHLLTFSPRPFLQMRNKNKPIYSLPAWESATALENFLRYIPDAIEKYVNHSGSFILTVRDIDSKSGRSQLCANLVRTICQGLHDRFEGRFKRIVIYRPVGRLATALSMPQCRNLPYSSYIVKYELVVAHHLGELAEGQGFSWQAYFYQRTRY